MFRSLTFTPPEDCGGDYEGALNELSEDVGEVLDLFRQRGCKFFVGLETEVSKLMEDEQDVAYFATKAAPLLEPDDGVLALLEHFERLIEKVDTFLRNGSGWIVHKVLRVQLYVTRYVTCKLSTDSK